MSATISEASQSASGVTDRRLMVQLPLLVRGMLTMSNFTPRHSGCRSSAQETRVWISSRVAGVFAKSVSKSIPHPLNAGKPGHGGGPSFRIIVGASLVKGALSAKTSPRGARTGLHGGISTENNNGGRRGDRIGPCRSGGRRHGLPGHAFDRDV